MLLFSYDSNSITISLTKCIEFKFSKYVMSKNNYIFFLLPQIICDVLKLNSWPVFKYPDVL